MVRLTSAISRLNARKILVAGDLVLDTYTIGKARRISPEAPVAIVNVLKEEHRPGMAGNVALNLISFGSEVVLMGRIGNDPMGQFLKNALDNEKIDVRGIVMQSGFSTHIKNRIIADNQQIVRVDHEAIVPLEEQLEQQLIDMLPELLCNVTAVAISDYGKGFLSPTLLKALIEHSKQRGLAIIADPKGVDFTKYKGSTIVKPNYAEAYAAAGMPLDVPLDIVAEKILKICESDALIITRSEAGISIFQKDSRNDFPVPVKEVKDVTGAGDTVLAMLSYALANQLGLNEAIQLSNVAAGIAIERLGCARVSLSELAHRLLEFDSGNKVFDDEHIFALQKALEGKKYNLLGLNGTKGLTTTIFQTIRKLSQQENRELLLYLADENPDEEFISFLASLKEVKFILVSRDNLRMICQKIEPYKIYSILDSECKELDSVEQFC